jgi:hypothetical protein
MYSVEKGSQDPQDSFGRHLPGLLKPTPAEQRIVSAGEADYHRTETPQEAAERLARMKLYPERLDEIFANRLLSHDELATIVISKSSGARVVSILNKNIRALMLLERGPIEPRNLSQIELTVLAPVLNDPDMQTEALKQALAP